MDLMPGSDYTGRVIRSGHLKIVYIAQHGKVRPIDEPGLLPNRSQPKTAAYDGALLAVVHL